MNKQDLVKSIAESADISIAAAGRALDGFMDAVTQALKQGDTVSLVGWGSFNVKTRAARTGRNPQTGKPIQIAQSKTPSFKAGLKLKEAVQ